MFVIVIRDDVVRWAVDTTKLFMTSDDRLDDLLLRPRKALGTWPLLDH